MSTTRSALITCMLGALIGCGHSERQVSPTFPTDPIPAPLSGDEAIWVTDSDLEVPHRQVALLRTHTYRREVLETRGVAELRAQALRMGAHAIIRVQAHPELTEELAHRPGNLTRIGTRWVTVYSLTGVAVAFDDPPPPPPTLGLELNLPPMD